MSPTGNVSAQTVKHMNFSSQQIEAITQSVLRELQSRGVAIAAPALTASTSALGKVITEDNLAAAGAAGQKISVPAGAIITPSGHDYIRRHAVTISSNLPVDRIAATGLVIIVGNCSAAVTAAETAKWSTVSATCEFDAARQAQSKILQPVVCCGGEPSITACLLNRDTKLRSAIVTQKTDIGQLNSVMNPQVICLDSSGWTVTELLRLFRQMSAIDRTTPANWQEIAGGAP